MIGVRPFDGLAVPGPEAAGEELLLQGVVDCAFEPEEGGLVVVDFKLITFSGMHCPSVPGATVRSWRLTRWRWAKCWKKRLRKRYSISSRQILR